MVQVLSVTSIREKLTTRYPMLLLDRVCIESDQKAWAIKNVSANEPFFVGHFPADKIMPGVLQVEAMRQLAELMIMDKINPDRSLQVYIRVLEKVKFRAPQRPGDRMKIECEIIETTDNEAVFACRTSNCQGSTCEAKMTLAARVISSPDKMPEIYTECDKGADAALSTEAVQKILPHRYPFLLIDYVAKMDNENVTVVKNLTCNEEMLQGIRSDFPVVPEAIQCEIVAQAGCILVLSRPENQGKIGYFMTIDRAEFYAPVFAGDQLVCQAYLPTGKGGRFGKGIGKLFVDGRPVGETQLMFAIVDPPVAE